MPKFKFSGAKGHGKIKHDSDADMAAPDVEIPDVDLSLPVVDAEIKAPLPSVDSNLETPKASIEGDVDAGADISSSGIGADASVNADLPSPKEKGGFGFKLPKVKFPSLKGHGKGKAEIDVPEIEQNAENPSISVNADVEPNISLKGSADTEMPSVGANMDLEAPDVTITGPTLPEADVEAPSVDLNASLPDADVSIEKPTAELKPDGKIKKSNSFKFKLPKFNLFGGKKGKLDISGSEKDFEGGTGLDTSGKHLYYMK